MDPLINQYSLLGPINASKLKMSELYISDPVPDSDDSDIEFEVNDEVPVTSRLFDIDCIQCTIFVQGLSAFHDKGFTLDTIFLLKTFLFNFII